MNDPLPYGAALPPRGWYPDPHTPGRDRWWTGQEWSASTVRTPRSLFGTDYARSMRLGPDWPARIAQLAVVVQLAAVFIGAAISVRPAAVAGQPWAVLPGVVIIISALIGLGNGIRGIIRSGEHGGLAVSIIAVVISAFFLLAVLFFVGAALITLFISSVGR